MSYTQFLYQEMNILSEILSEITCSLVTLTVCKNLKVIYISYPTKLHSDSFRIVSRKTLLFFSTIHLGNII